MSRHMLELLNRAEQSLSVADQAELVAIIETFIDARDEVDDFTDEERAHLAMLDAEPFVEAPAARLAAVFGRRG